MLPEKQFVVSAGISKTSYAEVVELCHRWAAERTEDASAPARYICVTSAHGLVFARDDASFAEILNSADIVTPDGMPVVWALRSLGARSQQRVYGPALMLELCRSAAEQGHRVYLYGGQPDVLRVLETRLCRQFPALRIVGRHAPPFRPLSAEEDLQIEEAMRSSDADLIFIGIGTPKQERWMFEHRRACPARP
jgi:N-acetylglucosaminyldiphosphoundecaprenol N-acetyl-beta-D-mannosaminyltransferase